MSVFGKTAQWGSLKMLVSGSLVAFQPASATAGGTAETLSVDMSKGSVTISQQPVLPGSATEVLALAGVFHLKSSALVGVVTKAEQVR